MIDVLAKALLSLPLPQDLITALVKSSSGLRPLLEALAMHGLWFFTCQTIKPFALSATASLESPPVKDLQNMPIQHSILDAKPNFSLHDGHSDF